MRRVPKVLLIGLVALGCGGEALGDPLAGSSWKLDSLSVEGSMRPARAEAPLTARFAEGELLGDTGCNRYGVPYSLRGEAFRLGDLLLTGAGCESKALVEQEDAFIVALEAVQGYSLSSGRLELLGERGRPLIVLTRQ